MPSLYNTFLLLGAYLPGLLAAPVKPEETDNVIPNRYIITLKDDIAAKDVSSHLSWVEDTHKRSLTRRDLGGVDNTYDIGNWHAYSGEFDEGTIAEIKDNPDVRGTRLTYPGTEHLTNNHLGGFR